MADETRSRLGRGLASLIGDMGGEPTATERGRSQRRVPIAFLRPNPFNPRKDFPAAQLDELAQSIKLRGMIQPIVARPVRGAPDAYEIIAGERRWQAAQRAGLHDVPVAIMDVDDKEALELAIIENVQREDLNPIEEASGYQALTKTYQYHPEEIAKAIGKSRSHVLNLLRLLTLPEAVRAAVTAGQLSAGHARALIGHPRAEQLAKDIIARGLSVRQVEELVRPTEQSGEAKRRGPEPKPADTVALEKHVSDALGLAVTIDHRRNGGAVHIRYRSLEQLRDVMRRLERS
jgi:ParB family transcriptional regulator, chromosome partitioning protein